MDTVWPSSSSDIEGLLSDASVPIGFLLYFSSCFDLVLLTLLFLSIRVEVKFLHRIIQVFVYILSVCRLSTSSQPSREVSSSEDTEICICGSVDVVQSPSIWLCCWSFFKRSSDWMFQITRLSFRFQRFFDGSSWTFGSYGRGAPCSLHDDSYLRLPTKMLCTYIFVITSLPKSQTKR